MKLFTIIFLTLLALSYTCIDAMEDKRPGQSRTPCDLNAVQWRLAVPEARFNTINPLYDQSQEIQRKEEDRLAALNERRTIEAQRIKSLQQRSADVTIENLLENLDNIEAVQEAINSYPLDFKTLFLDQIESKKAILDSANNEEQKKIEKLDTLESLITQALEKESKESKEYQENSPEKEEKLD